MANSIPTWFLLNFMESIFPPITSETVFLNFKGAQELIPRNQFRQLM